MSEPTDQAEPRPIAAVLAEAAELAGRAPSVLNTQPWHWRVGPETLDLFADRSRALPATDPDRRMLTISCGVALHHAIVALDAEGFTAHITELPSPDDPEHLARVTVTGRHPVTADAIRLVQAAEMRHTDRRPNVAVPVTADQLADLQRVADAEGAHLHRLTPDQVTELIVAVSRAEDAAASDPAIQQENAAWTGGERADGMGVPGDTIPARRPETDVGERDFGTEGTLPIGGGHDRESAYAVLFGDADDPVSWLRGGRALSAVWLRATVLGIALLPFSQVVEIAYTRELMHRMLARLGVAYIVLRLGVADPDEAGPPPSPRLRFDQIADVTTKPAE
jgi:hypothetical protein